MKPVQRILHFIILIVCLVLQITLVERLKLYYINLDLVMVVIIGITIFDGMIYGMIYGFITGMILDLMVGNIIGLSALIYALNGYIVSKVINIGLKKKIFVYILAVFFITEINLLSFTGIYYLFNFRASLRGLGLEMVIYPVCNIILMFMLFPLLQTGRDRRDELGFLHKDEI
jgi:rod shape-determining protein MreD